MKKIIFTTALCSFLFATMNAQTVINVGNDTLHPATLTIEGYVDAYYGYDFNKLQTKDRPYFVSHARNNEINVNLAYVSLKYNSERVRATFTPGFGTYMNGNYANETGTLKNLVEANVGFKPFADKNIWIDAGVLPSPYTNESAISMDQLVYSRSYGAENVPYYQAGARLSLPVTKKITANLYVLNGWQQISDVNNSLSFGSNVEIKATDKFTINWDTYIGNENSEAHPDYGMRYYTDAYALWSPTDKLSITACIYGGLQKHTAEKTTIDSKWWQANTSVKYAFSAHHSLSARVEYFDDKDGVIVQPITDATGFSSYSESLCYNWSVTSHVMFRVEARYFQSSKNVYVKDANPVKNDCWVLAGITTRF